LLSHLQRFYLRREFFDLVLQSSKFCSANLG
jgi:hypothetical protein